MKSGFVSVIGRANAGKSTLINVLVGEKVSIVSPKPQTTRDRIMGVYYGEDTEIAFIDTPGLYKADNMLNSLMQKTAEDSAKECDLIMFVIDAHEGIGEKDKRIISKFTNVDVPVILVLTKTDITPESLLVSEIKELSEYGKEIIPVSARKSKNLKELIKVIKTFLSGEASLFGGEIISDKSEKFMISEIMREKILLKFDKEIPHGVAIIVNQFELRENGKVYDINLDIICEKPNHKAILIGKQGEKIKEVSTFARTDMEKFLGKKVFLTTYIKVKEDWRNSKHLLKQHGYTEGN